MARKCKEDAEKTRLAILESALDVFSDKGFSRTTFDEIALRAGFTKGAIYWYFRNKADLVSALIIECMQNKRKEIYEKLPKENSLDDLLAYFVIWADAGQEDERLAKFYRFILCQMEWSEAILENVDKNLKDIKDFHLEKINKVLVECQKNGTIRSDVDIEKVQHLILANYMGTMFSTLSKRHNFQLVDMVRLNLGLFLDGLKCKKERV